MRLNYHDWIFDCDVEATRHAYSEIPKGSADKCTCTYCQNYRLVRRHVFPEEIQQFLTQLGINIDRECETWEYNREPSGLHLYGGMFFFIGHVVQEGTTIYASEKFHMTFKDGYLGPRVPQIQSQPSVEVSFTVLLPWVLKKVDEQN